MSTPGELLDRLGVRWVQVTEPDYGYTGSFTPRCAFGHWTASAAGSDVSENVLWSRSYHACVSRDGVVKLGGWQVRQGHGGEGRSTPMRLAISGMMSLDQLRTWQASGQADDTSSAPNQYGYGVCLDNNGVGEGALTVAWDAWCSAMAVFAVLAGATGPGWVIDHSASTNRKVDLSSSPALPVNQWWPYINAAIDELLRTKPTTGRRRMYRYLVEAETGHMYFSDKMTVRWCRTQWDNEDLVAQLDALGYSTTPLEVSRESLRLGEHGVPQGDHPPW